MEVRFPGGRHQGCHLAQGKPSDRGDGPALADSFLSFRKGTFPPTRQGLHNWGPGDPWLDSCSQDFPLEDPWQDFSAKVTPKKPPEGFDRDMQPEKQPEMQPALEFPGTHKKLRLVHIMVTS